MTGQRDLTFREYFILNKSTTIYCLKVCSIIFGIIATLIALAVEFKTGDKEDPLTVFIASELFGYGLAIFIFVVAILEGYLKAKMTINQFNRIDRHSSRQYSIELIQNSIELIQKPLNPKHWFMQFDIVQRDGDNYYLLDEQLKQKTVKVRHAAACRRRYKSEKQNSNCEADIYALTPLIDNQ